MSDNQLALIGAARPPATIVNAYSGGSAQLAGFSMQNMQIAKTYLSGALTANTLKSIISITGAGSLDFLSVYAKDATARTIRLQITMDGVVVFNATTGSVSSTGAGMVAVGSIQTIDAGSNFVPVFNKKAFNTSLLVEIASSLNETDKVGVAASYDTF